MTQASDQILRKKRDLFRDMRLSQNLAGSIRHPLSVDDSNTVVAFFVNFSKFIKNLPTLCYGFGRTSVVWTLRILKEVRCAAIKVYAGTTQFLSWIILWPLFHLLFKVRINGKENLRGLRGPHIIIANHTRFYDSFLFRLAVGFWSRLLPMRFMAVQKFDHKFLNIMKKIGIIPLVYGIFGVFVVEHGLGLHKNLKRAKEIIKNNGTVALFPEGRISRDGSIGRFRRGVSALALSTDTPVLSFGIHIDDSRLRNMKGRGIININIGASEKLQTHHTYEELAEILRVKVTGLVK